MISYNDPDLQINHNQHADDEDEEMEYLVDTTTHTDNNNMKVSVLWSELCQDLLGIIMGKLSLLDQARFHAVCKTWHSTTSTPTMSSLPWLVTVQESCSVSMHNSFYDRQASETNHTLEFKTYDPSCYIHSRPLSVFTISLTQLFGTSHSLPSYIIKINPAKHGWFFICAHEQKGKDIPRLSFVLFSPLTKKLITLPSLDYPCDSRFVFAFSTDPESPDCVFIIFNEQITVITLRNGDNEWKFRHYDESIMRIRSIPLYVEGRFYVVTSHGQVASYNTIDGEFKYESLSTDSSFMEYWCSTIYYDKNIVVFTLDGEIMVFFLSTDHTLSSVAPSSIRKFDWTNKVWIPVTNLGDHTLFVRKDTSSLVNHGVGAEAAAAAITAEARNKLYYFYETHYDYGCCVYSLENGELLQVKSILEPIWKGTRGVRVTPLVSSLDSDNDVLLEQIYNRVFRGRDDYNKPPSIFWLEPPVVA